MPFCSIVCKGISTCWHRIHPCYFGLPLHFPGWNALSYKPPKPWGDLPVPILSHSINSSSFELLNVMILYNLPPSLHPHYRNFITTTGQSVPARHFGL